MVFDAHMHTTYSTDGKMTPEDAIATARGQGLGVIFTEHFDADCPINGADYRVDVPAYMAGCEKLKANDALLGIEIGLNHLSADLNAKTALSGDFDYVLGGVHMIGKIDIYLDFLYADAPVVSKEEYLNYTLRMLKENDFYDAFAHIDYYSRYCLKGFKDPDDMAAEIVYSEFKDTYDAISGVLVEKEKPFEINTRRLKNKCARENAYAVLRGYKNRGGKYVTIGSDAHDAAGIGRNFDAALTIAKDLSLTPVYFKRRKMVLCNV